MLRAFIVYFSFCYTSTTGERLNFIVCRSPERMKGVRWRDQMLAVRRIVNDLAGKRGTEFFVDSPFGMFSKDIDVWSDVKVNRGAKRFDWNVESRSFTAV